jgi:hypothetical protein
MAEKLFLKREDEGCSLEGFNQITSNKQYNQSTKTAGMRLSIAFISCEKRDIILPIGTVSKKVIGA